MLGSFLFSGLGRVRLADKRTRVARRRENVMPCRCGLCTFCAALHSRHDIFPPSFIYQPDTTAFACANAKANAKPEFKSQVQESSSEHSSLRLVLELEVKESDAAMRMGWL